MRIETGTHSAATRSIDTDAAQRFLVSASDDKTSRVWDLRNGNLLKILRPPIGDFREGMLYAVAISPDGTTVAVGGSTGSNESQNHPIYIFDRTSGAIRKAISGLPNATAHLAYSKDGRYLAAGITGKDGIRIFEAQGYTEIARDVDYGDDCPWLEFDQAGRLLTASFDGFVRLYDSGFRLLQKRRPRTDASPESARFSPDEHFIAVGFENVAAVDVISANDLSFQYKLEYTLKARAGTHSSLLAVSWSEDARTLCAGGRYQRDDGVFPVFCWGHADKTPDVFPISGETITDLRALQNGAIAFSNGDATVGVLERSGAVRWRAPPAQLDLRPLVTGPAVLLVSSDGTQVEIGSYHFQGPEWTHHNLRFSVPERSLQIDPAPISSLRAAATGGLAVHGWHDDYDPTLNGRTLPLEPYEESRCLAVSPNRASFVLGTEWAIRKFDNKGQLIWIVPVPQVAFAVNITADGRFVVADLGDGTVRWYTFNEGNEVLALLVHHDLRRWVAWNPDGFFAFEGGGDQLVGYQINRGSDHAGDFVKVDQLREVFYRPDLISQILKPGGVEAVIAERRRISGDLSKPLVDKVLSGGPLPEIELLSPAEAEVNGEYRLEFRVKNAKPDANNIVVRYDGGVIDLSSRGDFDIPGTADNRIVRTVPVRSGTHEIRISAKDANGVEGRSRTIRLKAPDLAPSRDLYVVAAGISHYPDPAMNKGVSFAAADADYITAAFKKQEGLGLFQKVVPNPVPLLDSRATVRNISDAVANVATHIQTGDTFVLYLAGHGVAFNGDYYFIPWVEKYTSSQDLLTKSLTRAAIQNLLGQVKLHTQKVVLILDTCGASAVMGGADAEKESAAMLRVGNLSGYPILAASSSAALEGYENHGVFTFFLVEGMYKADPNAQGDIPITRLGEYTQTWVPRIAEQLRGSQQPVTNFVGEPFPLAHKVTN